ncbi:MAG: hypothetical protein CBARDMAM_5154 [uncultured Caballeronia sp.]|nr:MAG: hypothetical protein CBARDMAM_5154 [uncultured Caballeronia sp.]
MQVIVLAAEIESRLSTLTQDRPKTMVRMLDNEPALHRCMRHLSEVGLDDVSVVVGHGADLVRRETGDSFGSLRVHYV